MNDVHSLVLVFVKTWLPPSSSLQMLGEVSLKKMIYKWVAKGGGGGGGLIPFHSQISEKFTLYLYKRENFKSLFMCTRLHEMFEVFTN